MINEADKIKREDEVFAARIGRRLRDGANELDAATLSRLNRARQAALDAMESPEAGAKYGTRWLPVGAAVLLAVIAVTWWQGRVYEPAIEPVVADESIEFEMLLDDGDLTMYEELEFFAWLSEDELETVG